MAVFQADGSSIGLLPHVYVIAEIGSNHDGNFERALAMIGLAAAAGADAVKFQSFTADGLVARRLWAEGRTGYENPLHPRIDSYTLPADWHGRLQEAATNAGVDFLSTPFDLERLSLLDSLGVPAIKIASGDLTFEPLLRAAARTGRTILLSTGMAEFDEIDQALAALREEGNEKIVLLHCVTSYPTRDEDVNVRAVRELAKRYHLPVGLSDHSLSLAAPLAAVALGASVIERHLTFSRSLSGPDHPYAMEPMEFRAMVEEIRILERALGSGEKSPCVEEVRERLVGRRSIRAAADLPAGTVIAPGHLSFLRPGGGMSPFRQNELIGKRLVRGISRDEPFAPESVE